MVDSKVARVPRFNIQSNCNIHMQYHTVFLHAPFVFDFRQKVRGAGGGIARLPHRAGVCAGGDGCGGTWVPWHAVFVPGVVTQAKGTTSLKEKSLSASDTRFWLCGRFQCHFPFDLPIRLQIGVCEGLLRILVSCDLWEFLVWRLFVPSLTSYKLRFTFGEATARSSQFLVHLGTCRAMARCLTTAANSPHGSRRPVLRGCKAAAGVASGHLSSGGADVGVTSSDQAGHQRHQLGGAPWQIWELCDWSWCVGCGPPGRWSIITIIIITIIIIIYIYITI